MREELEEVREREDSTRGSRINHSIGRRRYFCRIFLNFRQAASNIWLFAFHCQDPCWHGAIDRDVTFVFRQIIHKPPSRFESRHYLSPQNRCIDLSFSLSTETADCRCGYSRNALTLLPRTLYRSLPKIDVGSIRGTCLSKETISLVKQ